MGLRVVHGSAGFVPEKTLFDCKKPGPPLAAGRRYRKSRPRISKEQD